MLSDDKMSWEPDGGIEVMTYDYAQSEFTLWLTIAKSAQLILGDILRWAALATDDANFDGESNLTELEKAKARQAWHWAQLIPPTYKESTLRVYKWVAESVPPENRIADPRISFSHIREIAHLPPDSQVWWLNKAIDNQWISDELKKHIRKGDVPERQPSRAEALFTKSTEMLTRLLDLLLDARPDLKGNDEIQDAYRLVDELKQETAVSEEAEEILL